VTRLRSLAAAVSPAGLVIPIVLMALLSAQSVSGMTRELDQAACLASDWRRAIEAFEGGAIDFRGACMSASIGTGGDIPEDFYQQIELADRDFEAAAERLTADPWRKAANHVGGAPVILFALFAGAMISGSPMGSGVAAWGLSNGWTRGSWSRSTLALTGIATGVAYALVLIVAVVTTYLKWQGAGVDASFPMPGLGTLAPLPGLVYFGMVGVMAGLITGRGEIGGMTAVVVAITDFLGSSRFRLSPFFPTSWHQTALETTPSPLSISQALGLMSAAAVVLAAVVYWYMTRRRDIPDR
jgi:hypothetical protein